MKRVVKMVKKVNMNDVMFHKKTDFIQSTMYEISFPFLRLRS
jgi:hypothetical protein